MRRQIIAAGLMTIGLSAPLQAQDADNENDEVTVLERITVSTPLRRESSLERSTSSVTVIDEEEIERSAALDLPSLLKSYAGITVTSNGGMGSASGIGIRGTRDAQTLVLVNGVNPRSATLGATTLANIPLDSIERIEIAKGPHSAQYGSDAIGGVINIITKGGACPTGNPVCTTVTTGISHPWGGTLGANVRGTTPDGAQFSFGGRLIGTQGYDFTLAPTEADDDGFLQGSFDFSASKAFDWGEVYATGLFSRSRSQYDNIWDDDNQSDTDLFAGKVGARIIHDDSWFSTVELSSAFDKSYNFSEGDRNGDGFVNSFSYDTYRHGIFLSTQKTFDTDTAGHIVTFGGEAYRENVESTVDYDVDSRDLAAAFAQYTLEYGALTVDAGIRFDHNSQFGEATTYNIGASYEVVPGLVVRASHGTGFRAPTFNDLYYPMFGNPNLQPETSKSYEIGLSWQPTDRTLVDIAVYRTDLRGAFDPLITGVVNVDRARIDGVEASISHRFDERWHGRAAIEFRDPVDLETGLYLRRQDRFKASAELGFRATEKLDLTARALYAGDRSDEEFGIGRVVLPAYFTFDIAATYRLDEQSDVKFAVENLFDEQYSTAYGYRSPGRTVSLSFSRTF